MMSPMNHEANQQFSLEFSNYELSKLTRRRAQVLNLLSRMSHTATMVESYPMTGGDGTYSYTKNSSFQREGIIKAKGMIAETIAHKLDIEDLVSASNAFLAADMGCSVGPNTFVCMENIIEAVKLKYQRQGLTSQIPEFQVFFNDHTYNDFNTLFRSLPPEKPYFAAAVPGSFHQRLFPEMSLHFVHTSHALHWLSQVPTELQDNNSPAWNRDRIFYSSAPEAVVKAYAAQFAKDMGLFFDARAKEVISGGMMVLIVPGIRDGISHSCTIANVMFDLLGSCLVDMAKEGSVSEALVNSFNLPMYFPSPKEMLELVERNGCFKIEKFELFDSVSDIDKLPSRNAWAMHLRAGLGGVFIKHFGNEIMDELFDRFSEKTDEVFSRLRAQSIEATQQLFLVLKHK